MQRDSFLPATQEMVVVDSVDLAPGPVPGPDPGIIMPAQPFWIYNQSGFQSHQGSVVFHFLSTLFSPSMKRAQKVDDALIEASIDRVLEGTDRRLLALGSYRKQLRKPVEKAIMHVIELVDALPEPVEISRQTYGSDRRLRAFFASCDHMQEKVCGAKAVENYFKLAPVSESNRVYGLLSLQWEEKSRLGTVLQNDHIQREVQQTYINFLNHSFLGPSLSIEEAFSNIKKRAFDFLIEIMLERIVAERTRYADLEKYRLLLISKLKAMRAGNWGLEGMLRPENSGPEDLDSLEAEIASVENELKHMGASHEVLERNLQIIKDTLNRPEELLATRTIQLELDSMNIKPDVSTSGNTHQLDLTELYSGIGATRILLPGWFPVEELPGDRESIAQAMRYL